MPLEIRKLNREMSIADPLWGAPRIHGELLKLGVDVGQTSVAKYMVKRKTRRPKMFVGPTISFRLLYGLLIMAHGRRHTVVWRHSASNRRMDRKSGHGSLRLRTGSPLSHS